MAQKITKAYAKAQAKKASGKELTKMTKAELLGTYYNEARNADIRLSNLEKLSQQAGFKTATQWAYARAMKDIENIFGDGKTRFDVSLPAKATKSQIMAYINDIRNFRASASSTKTGIVNVYKKRADTINKKLAEAGIKYRFTWQELATFIEDGTFNQMSKTFGSETAWVQFGKEMDYKMKDLKDEIKKSNSKTKRVDKKEAFKEVKDSLLSNGLSIEDLKPKRNIRR